MMSFLTVFDVSSISVGTGLAGKSRPVPCARETADGYNGQCGGQGGRGQSRSFNWPARSLPDCYRTQRVAGNAAETEPVQGNSLPDQ